MRVAIAGGHGKIALRLEKILAAHGDTGVGLIRNAEQAAALRDVAAEPVVLDLERASLDDVVRAIVGCDAAVFSAGAGPGSGAERKETVDRAAAVLFAQAAERAGIRRFVQVSAMGAGKPIDESTVGEVFAAYLRAKAAAEADLRERDLDWIILRPGRLTDEPGTGTVHLADEVPRSDVPRDDVAAVINRLLSDATTARRALELTSGHTPIDEAIARV